jgi:hypothetical protein
MDPIVSTTQYGNSLYHITPGTLFQKFVLLDNITITCHHSREFSLSPRAARGAIKGKRRDSVYMEDLDSLAVVRGGDGEG